MGYTAYVEKVFNLIDNGDLEWEVVVGMCLEYLACILKDRLEQKRYLKRLERKSFMGSIRDKDLDE